MLSPRAVKVFRNRERDDYSLWKAFSDDELERRMRALPVRPPIWSKLEKPQKVSFLIGAKRKRFLFLLDTGVGKTILSIALMRYFEKEGSSDRNLVLVPNLMNKGEWGDQFDEHDPDAQYVILTGSSENKWRLIEDNPDALAFIDTYPGFVRMLCKKEERGKGKRKRMRLVPDDKKVKLLAKFFQGFYLDESTYVSNHQTLPYRVVRKLSHIVDVVFPMTATPFGRDPIMAWAQAFIADRGYALGETLTLFRQAFYDTKVNFWGGFEHKLKPGADKEISACLDDVSITYPADEADLPQLSRIPKYASLGTNAAEYYEVAKAQIKASMGNVQEMKNAFLRMRQISSGFVGYRDDESGEKAKFIFPKQPKLDLLESVLVRIPEQYKFIVFHEFHVSGRMICDLLDDLGIKHVLVNGNTKDPIAAGKSFKDPRSKVRGLVLANSAGGYGNNFQIARYGIYYESPVGAILRKQTEKRFDRQHSPHKNVFLYDLIVRGTADESILEFHKEGKFMWKRILNTGARNTFDR